MERTNKKMFVLTFAGIFKIFSAFISHNYVKKNITSLCFLPTQDTTNKHKAKMVEDTSGIKKEQKSKTTRPKPVYLWTEADVQKWLRRHCSDYYNLYWEKFHEHDITGRALVRINDNTLLRMGITNGDHRDAIWREILKLRLKADIVEIRDLERQHNYYNYDL